jgi:hypothetical protein
VYKDNFHYCSCHPPCFRWHVEQHNSVCCQ